MNLQDLSGFQGSQRGQLSVYGFLGDHLLLPHGPTLPTRQLSSNATLEESGGFIFPSSPLYIQVKCVIRAAEGEL